MIILKRAALCAAALTMFLGGAEVLPSGVELSIGQPAQAQAYRYRPARTYRAPRGYRGTVYRPQTSRGSVYRAPPVRRDNRVRQGCAG